MSIAARTEHQLDVTGSVTRNASKIMARYVEMQLCFAGGQGTDARMDSGPPVSTCQSNANELASSTLTDLDVFDFFP